MAAPTVANVHDAGAQKARRALDAGFNVEIVRETIRLAALAT